MGTNCPFPFCRTKIMSGHFVPSKFPKLKLRPKTKDTVLLSVIYAKCRIPNKMARPGNTKPTANSCPPGARSTRSTRLHLFNPQFTHTAPGIHQLHPKGQSPTRRGPDLQRSAFGNKSYAGGKRVDVRTC